VDEHSKSVQLTDEQRIEWLRLIRSPNIARAVSWRKRHKPPKLR
jgi:hypothetical protein